MATAYTLQDREGKAGGGKGALIAKELSATLRAGFAQTLFQPVYSVENHPADSRVDIDESGKVQTLTSRMGTGGGNVPMVLINEQGCYWDGGQVAGTLTANNASGCQRMPDKDNFNCVIQNDVIALDRASFNQGKNAQYDFEISDKGIVSPIVAKGPSAVAYVDTSDGDIAGTLDASYYKGCGLRQGRERTFVAVAAVDCRNCTENSETNGTLQSHMAGGSSLNLNNVVRVKYIVRRLTPLECERLQGYPDGWTDIGEWTDSKGKVHKTSDAARYKALGNSIALPPWKWVLKRLCACYERDATLASLFDGIGGFPYLWEQINGKGTCLWASEIEEFPIAVTKARIGE
jgi:DNA (cytosine-5)-methyltransferase 1